MTIKIGSKLKKRALWALVAVSLGMGASSAYALPRQCRFQYCIDVYWTQVCYWDSGWVDC